MNVFDIPNPPLVYDIGSAMFRAGYAGDAWPELSIPSSCVVVNSDENKISFNDMYIYSKPSHFPIEHLIDDQTQVVKPDLLAEFMKCTHERLSEPLDSQFVALYTQPAHLMVDDDFGSKWRTSIAQASFETFNYDKICITADALLAAYSHCYHTATVVDFGWSCVRVIPIIEGEPIYRCSRFHICGGMVMSQILTERLKQRSISIVDPSIGFSKQQAQMIENRTAADIIKQCCSFEDQNHRVENDIDDPENLTSINGVLVDVNDDMEVLSNMLFQKIEPNEEEESTEVLPLSELLSSAIYNCPDKAKKALWSSIVTCGGFSTTQGFQNRLISDLVYDKTFERKVHFPMHEMVAGNFCVWSGGSIFASSPYFDRYCVSKQDYLEYGEKLLKLRCESHTEERSANQ